MKSFMIGLVSGAILVGVIAIFHIKEERVQKYEMGKKHGSINEFMEIYNTIKAEFGPIPKGTEERLLYSKKATDIVIIEQNGIKTIRAK